MARKAVQQGTVSAKRIDRWERVCQKLVALAEDVAEIKFEYRPAADVRTFADVLRHVGLWNRYVADSARGRKDGDTANELPRDGYSTKTRIVDALKGNASGLSADMAETVVTFIDHNTEHYGQRLISRISRFEFGSCEVDRDWDTDETKSKL